MNSWSVKHETFQLCERTKLYSVMSASSFNVDGGYLQSFAFLKPLLFHVLAWRGRCLAFDFHHGDQACDVEEHGEHMLPLRTRSSGLQESLIIFWDSFCAAPLPFYIVMIKEGLVNCYHLWSAFSHSDNNRWENGRSPYAFVFVHPSECWVSIGYTASSLSDVHWGWNPPQSIQCPDEMKWFSW